MDSPTYSPSPRYSPTSPSPRYSPSDDLPKCIDYSSRYFERKLQELRLSRKKRSYFRVSDSDDESSIYKSKKTRSRDTKPPSEPKKDGEKAAEDWSGYPVESEYEAGDKSPSPKAGAGAGAGAGARTGSGSQTSIRKPNEEAEYECEASVYGLAEETTTPNHHETTALKSIRSEKVISNSRAGKGENPNPWIAECDHGTAFLKFPIHAAHQPLRSHSIGKPDLSPSNTTKEHHAQPLIRAAWVGDFITVDNCSRQGEISATFDGLNGCVSSKACPQARMAVDQLPASIRWEKLPKWRVWPKSFEQRGPTDDDIAVFFFPSLAKHETVYESLLFDLIRDDLALRTTVMGSELLLFTSVDLPPLFTRFQAKLYMWGVFRGNQPRL